MTVVQAGTLANTEHHLVNRVGWLRAAVLGANDGILSTASLIVGVASATPDKAAVLVAGLAGLVAGAMSMAAGEYVSVSSQADTEAADIAREKAEIAANPQAETTELALIYQGRGLTPDLALQVSQAMMAGDALAAHTRDELGLTAAMTARPVQAGLVSALTVASGALLPVLVALTLPEAQILLGVTAATLAELVVLGAVGALIGGAPILRGALRVTVWGAIAMLATAVVGWVFGTVT
jgi:VIT1/CCC1 family predicted Fe2+/Mn2+ transporter